MSVASRSLLACLLALVLLPLLGACQAARMDVAPPLRAQTVEMPVQGRQIIGLDSDVTFGPYRAAGVRRGWTGTTTFGAGWGNLDYSFLRSDQRYEFVLLAPGAPHLRCQCAVGVNQQWLDLGMGRGGELNLQLAGQYSLACAMDPGDGTPPWRLTLGRGGDTPLMQGVLTSSRLAYQVRGSQRLAGTPILLTEATGYEFEQAGRPVAAVEVLNEGAVFMPPGPPTPENRALAAAAAALLLHQEIGRR